MKKLAAIVLFSLFSIPSVEAATEFNHCRIEGPNAVGYYCVRNGSGSASGRATLNVYNKRGRKLKTVSKIAVKVVINDCKDVIRTPVTKEAFYCELQFPQ